MALGPEAEPIDPSVGTTRNHCRVDIADETDSDLDLLSSYDCAVAVDLDHGIDRRTALHRHVGLVVPAFDVDRVRIPALATRARAHVREDRDDGWREAADLAETALAMLGGGSGDAFTAQ